MESHRSTKRRKLDTPHTHNGSETTSPTARHTVTPKSHTRQESAHDVSSQRLTNGTQTKSTHDAWQEAKAKSQAMRGKRAVSSPATNKAIDVYDDIDGASAHQSPLKKKDPRVSTPTKKMLDPLRNQKSTEAVTQSPSKGAGMLGFFKQFHKPKNEILQPVHRPDDNEAQHVNGDGPNETIQEAHISDDGSTGNSRSSILGKDTPSKVESAVQPGRGAWKGWVKNETPRRTFEDEIKELEEAARERAENGDADDTAAASSQQRRRKIQAPSADTHIIQRSEEKRKAQEKAKKPQNVSERRANNRADHIEPEIAVNDETLDVMEVDQAPEIKAQLLNELDNNVADQVSTTPSKVRAQSRTKTSEVFEKAVFSAADIRLIQTVVLEKLTGKRPIRLRNLDDEHAKVAKLVSQTVTAGESNSLLLIGARGSGKTALVNQILGEQMTEHPDHFHVVRLNGFIHTDDKIALREIWRQLGREMELDEEDSTSKNYADTMTRLLALLSHPAEQDRDQPDQATKSVIFVLDEFELFASHPRQTLLYNLFDIAQSRKAPIAVLGLTTRIDVAESLEKRVKSRFSHRYVHLSMAKSFMAFQEACQAAIALHSEDLNIDERKQLGVGDHVSAELKKASQNPAMDLSSTWNTGVELFLTDDVLAGHLRRLYYTTKSVPDFHASMLTPISSMPVDNPTSNNELLEHFSDTFASTLSAPDSKLNLLSCLSTLQLAILICSARLTAIHNIETVPFAQAYEEYKVLASKAKLQASASGALAQGAGSRIWSKDVAKGAWEELIDYGLILEDGNRGGRVDVGLGEIGISGVELGSWGRWCKEI